MLRNLTQYVCPAAAKAAFLLCTIAFHGLAAERQVVVVLNGAGIDAETLAVAEENASSIFRRAGIELIWEGLCRPEDGKAFSHCDGKQHPLFVHLLPSEHPTLKSTLGLAARSEQGSDHALIFCSRLEEIMSTGPPASRAQVLGNGMAHEIGHLLSILQHTSTGLLKANWSYRDYQQMARTPLPFSTAEAVRMRTVVLGRTGQTERREIP